VRNHEFEEFLKEYLRKESIEGFVIGYPRTMNNEASEAVNYINPFVRKLSKTYPGIPVHLVDERFTSEMALSAMIEGGVRKKQRRDKTMVDKISAAIILQSFLDRRKLGVL
jgi:putative Holliday junction resolvase